MGEFVEPEFLGRLHRRDPAAVAEVVKRHSSDLLNGALALGVGEAAAEELAADTFDAFLDAAPRFEGRSSVKTYLFGILYRKAMERGRHNSRESAREEIDAAFDQRFNFIGHWRQPPRGPEEENLTRELGELIRGCLKGLKPLQKAAFLMREVQGCARPAICHALDIEDTHLRVLLFRARNHLRECLEKKWGNG